MDTLEQILQVSPAIRYVALYRRGELVSRQRSRLGNASAAESDRYEELLVNPTLLKLVQQRGAIDCGGAQFVVIRYGHFYQLVIALPDGHVSVAFELDENPLTYADSIQEIAMAA